MKINFVLSVNGKKVKLADHDVRLDLFSPSRASFIVVSSQKLSGVVTFDVGYSNKKLQRYFSGYIEGEPSIIDDGTQRIFCREITASLVFPLLLSLRNIDFKDLLSAITKKTNIIFGYNSSAEYIAKRSAFFYSMGNGYHCMDSIGAIYNINKYIWQQQGDGRVFVGSWDDSFWSDREVTIPSKIFVNHGLSNTATMSVIPDIRAGVKIKDKGIVKTIKLIGSKATIEWSKNPWMQ